MESLLKNQDTPQTDLFVADRTDEPSSFQNAGSSELGVGYQVDVDIRAFEDSTIESTEPEIENTLPIWDMVSLGVEEALPTPKVQDALWVYDSGLLLELTNVPSSDIKYILQSRVLIPTSVTMYIFDPNI